MAAQAASSFQAATSTDAQVPVPATVLASPPAPPSVSNVIQVSNEYHQIAEHEKSLRIRIERFESEIAAAEDLYLRQYTGNIIQGWESEGIQKRRHSDRIFSASSSTYFDPDR
jgi:hypothetical protein